MNRIPETKFDSYITKRRGIFDGEQKFFTFENGYSASVAEHIGSRGLELEIFSNGSIDRSTPIAKDTVRYIKDADELEELLERIKNL